MALSHLKSSSSGSNFLKPLATAFSLRRPISTSTDPITVESSIAHCRNQSPRTPLLLPRHGHHAPYGDRRRLSIQGQAHPRILPPLRRPRSRGRWYGGLRFLLTDLFLPTEG
ncbi:hypothetical protein OIU79_020908 [Salix purpurea]|uniref:Uncharacterized protein n=1 Tax=Salix purpurea TaxID=77065 RepID=A0A9Q0WMS0_SALPP|nr:hypothetical protein OIU79_020908 [Salix purpurea]